MTFTEAPPSESAAPSHFQKARCAEADQLLPEHGDVLRSLDQGATSDDHRPTTGGVLRVLGGHAIIRLEEPIDAERGGRMRSCLLWVGLATFLSSVPATAQN